MFPLRLPVTYSMIEQKFVLWGKMEEGIQLFEDQRICAAWDEEDQEWYFSIVDAVGVLTEQETHRGASNYCAKFKERLKAEGSQLLTNCKQLKMRAEDGKLRLTDVATTEQLLRSVSARNAF